MEPSELVESHHYPMDTHITNAVSRFPPAQVQSMTDWKDWLFVVAFGIYIFGALDFRGKRSWDEKNNLMLWALLAYMVLSS